MADVINNIKVESVDWEISFDLTDGPVTANCRVWSNPECREAGDAARVRIDSIWFDCGGASFAVEIGGGPRSYVSCCSFSPRAREGRWTPEIKQYLADRVGILADRIAGRQFLFEFGEPEPGDDDYEEPSWW